jgi:TPR repeat protein/S1-C subfamily serine protease
MLTYLKLFVAVTFLSLFASTRLLAQDSNTNTSTTTESSDLFKETLKKAEAGYAWAQYNLGIMYVNGKGVPQDYKEAVKWYTKAAEQGYASAQYNLGAMYAEGQVVPQDYKEAVKWYTKAAEQGYASAQFNLGTMYGNGQGVPQDYKEEVKWYTKAAEQGYASAQFNLGVMYGNGHDIPQDYKEAVKWFSKAAEQGNAEAQYTLGNMYNIGRGVEQDYREAVKWYTMAAKQGNIKAQGQLASIYRIGQGVPQDYKEAVKWYTKAAEQGGTSDQFSLGLMYEDGKGVPQNYIEAYKWLNLAAAQGITGDTEDIRVATKNIIDLSAKARDRLKELMSPAQIAEAQRLSKEFKPKTHEPGATDAQTPEKAEIKGNGTGFFITTDGYLLTAHHVIKEASSVQVWTSKGLSPAKVVRVDAANDIALLKVDVVRVESLAVQSSRDVKVGQEIFTLGFPNIQIQGTEAKYTQGNINSLSGMGDDPRMFQISTAVQPGNSGGPLLNEEGQVIGLVVAKLDEIATAKETGSLPQNVNYALKSSFVLSFLESLPELNGKLLEPKKSGLTRTQVVEKTSKAVVMVLCY